MPIKSIAKFITVSLLLASVSLFASAASSWSYLVKTYPLMGNDAALAQPFNKLGSEGWELVTCAESSARITCIFKRPTKE